MSEPSRDVVAVVLTRYERVGLFKRSRHVRHDAGAWHCITGYVDPGRSPLQQAVEELWEETGLRVTDLHRLVAGPVLDLPDVSGGRPWVVNTFAAATTERRLTLNWEHDQYRWVRPARISRFDGRVTWLADVLAAVLPATAQSPRTPSYA
jgi:8-oxo-dGTP pyrophosphatase MutT (NUDIX family)